MTADRSAGPDVATVEDADRIDEREPSTFAATRWRAWDQVLGGILLVVAGVLWLVETATDVSVPWRSLLPAALVVVGLATITLALRRPAGELIGIGVALTVLVVISALVPARFGFTVGERTEQPTTVTGAADGYGHGIGTLEVDLRRLDLSESVTVEAGVGVGELIVVVPEGVTVEVRATAGVGSAVVFDRESGGIGAKVEEDIEEGDGPTLRIDASVGVGEVRVVRS